MKLISIKCPNCGSSLNIDLDNISRFCGKCGSKVMLDVDTIQALLIEKEKTKQDYIKATEQSKQMQIIADQQKRIAELEHAAKMAQTKSNNIGTVMAFIVAGIVGIAAMIYLAIKAIFGG